MARERIAERARDRRRRGAGHPRRRDDEPPLLAPTMTRSAYSCCVDERERQVRRLLDRYIAEIVEHYDLCPWARPARTNGELAVAILWAAPSWDAGIAAATELLARPQTRVAMVVAPELPATPAELRAVRHD